MKKKCYLGLFSSLKNYSDYEEVNYHGYERVGVEIDFAVFPVCKPSEENRRVLISGYGVFYNNKLSIAPQFAVPIGIKTGDIPKITFSCVLSNDPADKIELLKDTLIKYVANVFATENAYLNVNFCPARVDKMEFNDSNKKILEEEVFPAVRKWYAEKQK